jgi:hypothetical protein
LGDLRQFSQNPTPPLPYFSHRRGRVCAYILYATTASGSTRAVDK